MMKRLILASFLLGFTFFACKKDSPAPTEPEEVFPDIEYTAQPSGVNLAGAEFGEDMPGLYGQDYTWPNVAELDYFKSKNLRLIRVPFRWERIQPSLYGPLDPAELGRMKAFISAAQDRDMLILLDMHNYGRRKFKGTQYVIGSAALPTATVTDVWVKLANELKSFNNIWGYGLMNEPHDMSTPSSWFNIAQELITKIREVDTETTIVVGGDSFSSAARWLIASDNLKNLEDPSDNIVFEAHIYFDASASGFYDYSYNDEKATPETGVERAKPFVDWLKKNGFKGFIGELGVPDDDERWLVTMDNMLKYLHDNCINTTYWAAGPWWDGHKMSVEPIGGVDRPQLPTLLKYTVTDPANCN